MPRKLPPYVEAWRDRHGRLRVYFRKDKGQRIALPSTIGSEEFLEAYQAALAGRKPTKPKRMEPTPGTIEALVQSYLRSADYRDLRATTKAGYTSRIEAIRTAHGHRTLSGMNRERIEKLILAPYAERPGAALNILKIMRVLIRHARAVNMLQHDPSVGIKRPKVSEIRSWTDNEIAQFEAHWPIGTKQRLAFALMLFTGQRRSDVHRMTWADIERNGIRVTQQKTREKLTIPLHASLVPVLRAVNDRNIVIITTAYGRPFTVDGFSQFMRDAIRAAGLGLDCKPHGLRKAQGRRMAEAGCTPHEIMAVLGHKSLAEAERYTRDADQLTLATAAIMRLEGRKVNRTAQTDPEKFGETAKSKGETK